MAMNRQDYITEGTVMFENGMNRPVGNSWQVKAMQVGYDVAACNDHDKKIEEQAREGAEKVNSRPLEVGQKESEGEGSQEPMAVLVGGQFVGIDLDKTPVYSAMNGNILPPQFHHLNFLEKEIQKEKNWKRRGRLIRKQQKLTNKWAML